MRLVKEECKYYLYDYPTFDMDGVVDISVSDIISGKKTTGYLIITREYTYGNKILRAWGPPIDLCYSESALWMIRKVRKEMRLKVREEFKKMFEREYLDALYEISEIFLASNPKSKEWDRFTVLSGRIRELEKILFKTDSLLIGSLQVILFGSRHGCSVEIKGDSE